MKGKLTKDYWTIKSSGLFDPVYYLKQYPDVRRADIEPLEHFVIYGWKEGRNPNQWFDTNHYLANNPDVARAGVNPFVHWIKSKMKQEREEANVHNNYPKKLYNKRKLIFHIGMPKCGSSAIQKFLCSPIFKKIAGNGYEYVVFTRNGKILWGEQIYLLSNNAFEYVTSDKIFDIERKELESIYRENQSIICSHEWWGRNIEHFINTVERIFSNLNLELDLEIIMCVRPQVEWLNSGYWQWGAWEYNSFEEFLSVYLAQANYYLTISKLRERLPSVKIEVILLKNNVLEDFMKYLGLDNRGYEIDLQRYIHNRSLPSVVLRLFQRHPKLRPGPHHSYIDFILNKYTCLEKFKPTPWVIRFEKIQEIIEHFRDDNLKLLELLNEEQRQRMLNEPKWWSADAFRNKEYESEQNRELDSSELELLAVELVESLVRADEMVRKSRAGLPGLN